MPDAPPNPTPARAADARRGGRDPRIDTAKGVLIVLVVLGHLLESVDRWQEGVARMPLIAIYLFHMPAFVFLAGVTTRGGSQWRQIATLLLLLASFQVVYLATWSVISPDASPLWYQPFWLLWFLLAMVWWHALAPLILRTPRTAFAASVLVALGVGAVPLGAWNGPLALSRTLVFLPFFVAGCVWGKPLVERAAALSSPARIGWTVVAIVTIAVVLITDPSRNWLYGSVGYGPLGASDPIGIAVRGSLLVAAAIASFTLLAWMPPHAVGGLTVTGKRSLGVYLFHGLIVGALTPVIGGAFADYGVVVAWTLSVVTCAGIVALLAAPGPDRVLRAGTKAAVTAGDRAVEHLGEARER